MRKQTLLVFTAAAAVASAASATTPAASPAPAAHLACPQARHVASHHRMARMHHDGMMAMHAGWSRHWRHYGWRQDADESVVGFSGYRGEHGSFHDESNGWAMSDGGVWADEGYTRHFTVDRFGYLDWPGKSHFVHDAPVGGPSVEGPPPPPPPGVEAPPPPPPSDDSYEIRRF